MYQYHQHTPARQHYHDGYKVFGGCSNLESANYPVNWVNSPSGNGSNSYEYGNVFSGCPKLTEIEIPEGVR